MARQKSDTFRRTVKYFDGNFDPQEKSVEGKVPVARTYEEAVSLFGNDSEKILDALNQVLREQTINAAMQAASGGMEERFISQFIKPLRAIPPFNGVSDEKDQTKQILAKIKTEPFLLDSLKAFCAAKAAEGDEDQ